MKKYNGFRGITMIVFLMFLGIVLAIIKANGWIVIPTFCIVFCWITSFFSWLIYSYGRGIADEYIKNKKTNKLNKNDIEK